MIFLLWLYLCIIDQANLSMFIQPNATVSEQTLRITSVSMQLKATKSNNLTERTIVFRYSWHFKQLDGPKVFSEYKKAMFKVFLPSLLFVLLLPSGKAVCQPNENMAKILMKMFTNSSIPGSDSFPQRRPRPPFPFPRPTFPELGLNRPALGENEMAQRRPRPPWNPPPTFPDMELYPPRPRPPWNPPPTFPDLDSYFYYPPVPGRTWPRFGLSPPINPPPIWPGDMFWGRTSPPRWSSNSHVIKICFLGYARIDQLRLLWLQD